MFASQFEGVASQRQRAGGIAQALDVEPGYLFLESTRPEQKVAGGNTCVLEIQLAPLFAVHETGRFPYRESRRSPFDQHRAYSFQSRPKAHIDQEQIRLWAVGGEYLAAVDQVVAAILAGAGL